MQLASSEESTQICRQKIDGSTQDKQDQERRQEIRENGRESGMGRQDQKQKAPYGIRAGSQREGKELTDAENLSC